MVRSAVPQIGQKQFLQGPHRSIQRHLLKRSMCSQSLGMYACESSRIPLDPPGTNSIQKDLSWCTCVMLSNAIVATWRNEIRPEFDPKIKVSFYRMATKDGGSMKLAKEEKQRSSNQRESDQIICIQHSMSQALQCIKSVNRFFIKWIPHFSCNMFTLPIQ